MIVGDDDCEYVFTENSKCPYLQPVDYSGMRKCRIEKDCERGFTCCFNIAGDGFCHKPSEEELMKTN